MISTKIQLRFADCDMAGHVHNAAYLHFFESARIHFFVSGLGKNWDWKKNGLILKKNIIEYIEPTYIEDEIQVQVTATHIGTKSFTLSYSVLDQNGHQKTFGESILVCFDYHTNHTVEIPDEMRDLLEKHLKSAKA